MSGWIPSTNFNHRKNHPAAIRIVTLPGSSGASTGKAGNKFLSHIREVDAILHVVRCFAGAISFTSRNRRSHSRYRNDRHRLALADLETFHPRWINPNACPQRHKEAIIRAEILRRCRVVLDQAKPVRSIEFNPEEKKIVKPLGLMTAKKCFTWPTWMSRISGHGPLAQKVRDRAKARAGSRSRLRQAGGRAIRACPGGSQGDLESLGLKEPALATLARERIAFWDCKAISRPGPMRFAPGPLHRRDGSTGAGVIHTILSAGLSARKSIP